MGLFYLFLLQFFFHGHKMEVIEDAELIEETTDVSPVKDPTIKVESSDKNSETTEPPKKEK